MKKHDRYWEWKLFRQILKNSYFYKAFVGYIIFLLVTAVIIQWTEPDMHSYWDALWYTFVSGTTIGFGDFAATGFVGRILTIIIYIYTVLIIALLTAIFTQLFFEMAKARKDETLTKLQADLENLPELPKERLEEISKVIKEMMNT